MPIIKSAKKALRGSLRKRVFNLRRAKDLNEVLKNVKKLVSENKLDEAKKMVPEAYKAIDKAFKRGVIKGNTAARKKSRLMLALNKK
ncbi:MAG: 30S ribosomal protein S20 [Patescibacteria group bacterium]